MKKRKLLEKTLIDLLNELFDGLEHLLANWPEPRR
jgi:hypothetical protein